MYMLHHTYNSIILAKSTTQVNTSVTVLRRISDFKYMGGENFG
jgi:hypothetical protein